MSEPTLFDAAQAVKPKQRFRSKNNNWRGGRSLASNGYMLLRVGVNHPLADVRGYAYEHRVVASKKIGRWVKPEEHVHHINGVKTDNRPENLQVMASHAHHFVEHRRVGFNRRMPDEQNEIVVCQCGCGQTFLKFDDDGRPRKFVSGHNPQPAPTMLAIAAVLSSGPLSRKKIRNELHEFSATAVNVCLSKMKARGLVEQKDRGVWALR